MAFLKGIPVTLYDRVKNGVDDFDTPVFQDVPVTVKNVLVCPAGSDEIVTDQQANGKMAAYELLIPKDDAHIWEGRTVEFYGQKWTVFGIPEQWIPENIPGPWNKRVKVKRYA